MHRTGSLGFGYGEEIVFHSQDSCHRLEEQKEVAFKKPKISFEVGALTDDLNDLELSTCGTESDKGYHDIIHPCESTANHTSGILKSRYQNNESKNNTQCGQFNSTSNDANKQNSGIHIYKNKNSLKKVRALSEKHDQEIPPLVKVESALQEWYTIDTLRLIKGDDFVRQVLRENGCTVSSVVAAVGFTTDEQNLAISSKFREKYIELCRKLDLLDLEVSVVKYMTVPCLFIGILLLLYRQFIEIHSKTNITYDYLGFTLGPQRT